MTYKIEVGSNTLGRYHKLFKKMSAIETAVADPRLKHVTGRVRKQFMAQVPSATFIGSGAFKTAYLITLYKQRLVLKIGRPSCVKAELGLYNNSFSSKRQAHHRYAKIYWATEHCILQKYGETITDADYGELRELKRVAKHYFNLTDVRKANVKRFGSRLKMVDAMVRA